MKNLLIIIISVFISTQTLASIPTIEGLFRNGINPEPSGELVVVKALVERTEALKQKDESEEMEKSDDISSEPLYLKFIFSLEIERRIQLIQVFYKKGRMHEKDLLDVQYFRSLDTEVAKGHSIEQGLFYSLLNLLSLNKSSTMMTYLKKRYPEVQANKEIVNKEKIQLLEKYKNYLIAIKEDETLKGSLKNPLHPDDPEAKQKVTELMNSPTLVSQEAIILKREGRHYYWCIVQEGLTAKFKNDTHRLKHMKLVGSEGEIEIDFGEYLLFNGLHQLPKEIFFKVPEGKTYKIRFTSLRHFTPSRQNKKTMIRRFSEYKKKLAEVRKEISSEVSFLQPQFLKY